MLKKATSWIRRLGKGGAGGALLFFFITLKPRVEWYKSLWALHARGRWAAPMSLLAVSLSVFAHQCAEESDVLDPPLGEGGRWTAPVSLLAVSLSLFAHECAAESDVVGAAAGKGGWGRCAAPPHPPCFSMSLCPCPSLPPPLLGKGGAGGAPPP